MFEIDYEEGTFKANLTEGQIRFASLLLQALDIVYSHDLTIAQGKWAYERTDEARRLAAID